MSNISEFLRALFYLTTAPLAVVLIIGSAPAPAAEKSQPLSAIMVSQCGKALAVFVQVDATHLLRADQQQTDIFVGDGDYTNMKQVTSAPLKFDEALKLAESASIQTHVAVKCDESGYST